MGVTPVRRPTRAAGYSWRKWEDPVEYARPWWPDILFWALCIVAGLLAGIVVAITPSVFR